MSMTVVGMAVLTLALAILVYRRIQERRQLQIGPTAGLAGCAADILAAAIPGLLTLGGLVATVWLLLGRP